MIRAMTRTNRSLLRRIIPVIWVGLYASCSQEPADGVEDRFKKLVDISRDEAALKEYLKPVPPTEPADAIKTFETADGFQMQLVAHEPMVNEPVAATFDENGRMYVAELKSYPYQPGEAEEPTGRVRLLEDKDGDGVFDVSHVFADGLVWPTGVAVFKGGVYISAPPSIFYMKDTDGDGKADIRKVVYTGFGVTNEQQMVNNLIWGVDHKIYASTGGDGGYIRPGDQPNAEPISVYDRDFRFDPVSGAFELTGQTFQFGHSFDDWYNRFVCTAGSSGRHVVMPGGYLERNPYLFFDLHGFHWEGHGSLEVNPLVQGSTRIYKISPIERWRTIREARRVFAGRSNKSAGVGHSYQTAGAGVQVYRGHAYPEKYRGSIFIGANTANLYHRRVLEEDGVTFKSVRGEPDETEFVRSTDNWFRPVNSINAPDGTMYVLDMYRELIEAAHVPERVVKHLDFTRGQDRGRIYRVAPPGFKVPPAPRLGDASIEELIGHLEHPGGWWRETAHRLIYERQDAAAAPLLRGLLKESSNPLARMHALWSLKGLAALQDGDLSRALSDASPGVRAHAVRLAESRLNRSPSLFQQVLALAEDDDPKVRFRVALTLGEAKSRLAFSGLVQIALRDSADRWTRNAVLSSSAKFSDRLLVKLVGLEGFVDRKESGEWLSPLARVIGARNKRPEVDRLTQTAALHPALKENEHAQQIIVTALADGLAISGKSLAGLRHLSAAARRMIQHLMDRSETLARDTDLAEEERVAAIRLLAHGGFDRVRKALTALIDFRQPQAVQLAGIEALTGYDSADIPALLLESWESQTPEVRNKVLIGLLSREHWTRSLLETIEKEQISSNQIDPKRRELLMSHRDEAIRARAVTLFDSQAPSPRQEVLANYQATLTLTGDRARGETVYRRECIKCHRLSSTEHLIGPNLIMGSYKDPEPLLTNILDPNRFVEPQYLEYVVTDKKQRLFTGILTDQTATSVTLLEGEDLQNTVLRKDIQEIRATGKSLMPEGLEENVNHQEMADLLKFILDYQYVIGTESAGYGPGDEVYEPLATRRWGSDDRNRR